MPNKPLTSKDITKLESYSCGYPWSARKLLNLIARVEELESINDIPKPQAYDG